MKEQVKTTSVQLIKYGLVGISNSLLTFIVIYICFDLLSINIYVSDVIGYIVGLINSFVWNKQWVFKSHNHKIKREILLFVLGFLLCFGIQIFSLWAFMSIEWIKDISLLGIDAPKCGEYISIIGGMATYTICNYIYNRFVTFKPFNEQPQ
ncbi:MAG: GtrA family protein [Muribaculaceae bacterium]|nr:GtrA family protein [Muribaculaceae bacterium]